MKANIAPFIIGLLMTSPLCYSQTLDHAQLEIIYQYEMIGNRLDPETKMKDETILLIGNKYTAYFSFVNYIRDSLRKANPVEYRAQVATNDGRVLTPRSGETQEELQARGGTTIIPARTRPQFNTYNKQRYIINRSSGEVLCLDMILDILNTRIDPFSYTEILEKPIWKISVNSEMIVGYHAQKATTRYGGRDWTVWFTHEIPVSEGPWKLRGLPGLILKAETADGEYALTATSVSRSGRAIVKDEENVYRNISKIEFIRLKKEGMVNPYRAIEYNHIEILK
jgi:GLPGLI family protein